MLGFKLKACQTARQLGDGTAFKTGYSFNSMSSGNQLNRNYDDLNSCTHFNLIH